MVFLTTYLPLMHTQRPYKLRRNVEIIEYYYRNMPTSFYAWTKKNKRKQRLGGHSEFHLIELRLLGFIAMLIKEVTTSPEPTLSSDGRGLFSTLAIPWQCPAHARSLCLCLGKEATCPIQTSGCSLNVNYSAPWCCYAELISSWFCSTLFIISLKLCHLVYKSASSMDI